MWWRSMIDHGADFSRTSRAGILWGATWAWAWRRRYKQRRGGHFCSNHRGEDGNFMWISFFFWNLFDLFDYEFWLVVSMDSECFKRFQAPAALEDDLRITDYFIHNPLINGMILQVWDVTITGWCFGCHEFYHILFSQKYWECQKIIPTDGLIFFLKPPTRSDDHHSLQSGTY